MYTIELTEEQLQRTISCVRTTISEIKQWNFGDEYDTDITPFQELEKFYNSYLNDEV